SVYIPRANITAACNVLLTITLTIERLVSIRWPMEKQCLFNSNRILITLVICFLFPAFAYKIGACSNLTVTSTVETKAYKYFGVNYLLLSTLHTAGKKLKAQRKCSESIILVSSTACLQSIMVIREVFRTEINTI
ncbi:unnamed protein product, partial [Rotaria magnacalcarata]